jgi:hypothetical protein
MQSHSIRHSTTKCATIIDLRALTRTIRRNSRFDGQNSIDPWGPFTLYTSGTCKPSPSAVVRRSQFGRWPSPKIPRRTPGRTTFDPARACRAPEGRGGPPGNLLCCYVHLIDEGVDDLLAVHRRGIGGGMARKRQAMGDRALHEENPQKVGTIRPSIALLG